MRACVTLLCRNLLTISAFYGLPVIQLVFVWSTQVADGNQDLCWYNHLCARPFGPIYAFNAVFSNIGYVALGFLFVLITAHKHVRYVNSVICPDTGEPRRPLNVCCRVRASLNAADTLQTYGLPRHFGLFYSIGVAIMMEGVLSAAYHVCPSPNNYQFGNVAYVCGTRACTYTDTAYMYMIGTLGMVQIYALRHPDVNANAHVTYMVMAAVILTAMTGVYLHGTMFWIIFAVLYAVLIVLVALEFYYKGRWSIWTDTCNSVRQWWRRLMRVNDDGRIVLQYARTCTVCRH